jgi:hypothetical protein
MVNEQPEALRLTQVAPYLEGGERGQWIMSAAAELRRLHFENKLLHERHSNSNKILTQLESVNQELLAALKQGVDETLDYIKRNHLTGAENNHWIVQARSAIAKAERTTP